MGQYLFDQYTLLHFSVGIVAYFWGINLPTWAFGHILFEIIENTKLGMQFINNFLFFWPGGKPKADSFLNILGDNIFGISGWLVARALDKFGVKMGWYPTHIDY